MFRSGMTAPFILIKSYKNAGLAILLTLIFGPVGLFYASVTAGLTMTFVVPLLLVLSVFIAGYMGTAALDLSIIFTLVVIAFYWLICILWAVTAVAAYNRKIEEEYERQQRILSEIKDQEPRNIKVGSRPTDRPQQESNSLRNTNKPDMHTWMKENPGKGINDYFMKFGQ